MNSGKIMSVAAAFVLGMSIGQAQAADLTEPVPGSSGWTFTGAAYLWASGL